jgi:hypothetical protein
MGYFSEVNLAMKIHGVNRTSGPICICGRKTSILGFTPPNSLQVYCDNRGCKMFNKTMDVGAHQQRIR